MMKREFKVKYYASESTLMIRNSAVGGIFTCGIKCLWASQLRIDKGE